MIPMSSKPSLKNRALKHSLLTRNAKERRMCSVRSRQCTQGAAEPCLPRDRACSLRPLVHPRASPPVGTISRSERLQGNLLKKGDVGFLAKCGKAAKFFWFSCRATEPRFRMSDVTLKLWPVASEGRLPDQNLGTRANCFKKRWWVAASCPAASPRGTTRFSTAERKLG